MKRSLAPKAPFHLKFFKEVPAVDASGKEIPQNPPLTKSFWVKPKTTADILHDNTKKHKKKPRK